MGKHRGREDRNYAPGTIGRELMTDEEAKALEEAFPPITTDARYAQDARLVDRAYDRRGKNKK